MDDEIATLRRQLEEERQLREEAERRQKEERQGREEAERRQEETKRRGEENERRLQSNSLFPLLDRCHCVLSQAIQVETKAALTTQGNTSDPVNRLYPKRILPWVDFPRLQEEIWEKFDSAPAFTTRLQFPSNTQLDYVAESIQNKPLYSEGSLRNFERDTVDSFVEKIIDALIRDETLREEFSLQGRVIFQDRAATETEGSSLEEGLEHIHIDDPPSPRRHQATGRSRQRPESQKNARPGRRRNRRADQFCVHVVSGERQVPAYAVEFKAPHKLTLPELVAGLHAMEPARDVINQEGDTFEFHATHLVAAVITQIFSYMVDSGVQYGYLCTGEAFVFLHIPKDPTSVYYYLCVPNQDVQADDEYRLHRTAVGQVLAFTLQALAAELPSQEWHDTAHGKLSTWEVEYLDVLRDIPETIRKEPPPSVYRSSSWKSFHKTYNTRSRRRCRPDPMTPEGPLSGGSGSDDDLPSPSTSAAARNRGDHSRNSRKNHFGGRRQGQSGRSGRHGTSTQQAGLMHAVRPYCTMKCIRGLANGDHLDQECPNVHEHGVGRHSITSRELTRRLHSQLLRDRNEGFEPLHIRGRTGFLLKASLLSHGYTVVIKATTAGKASYLRTEVDTYRCLAHLQGYQIPVCVGDFKPRIPYYYHGKPMGHMMILSWSGIRIQSIINEDNSAFFRGEREKLLKLLRSHGVTHNDAEWRNMLWNDSVGCMVMIDFEEVTWSEPRLPLGLASGNRAMGANNSLTRKGGQATLRV